MKNLIFTASMYSMLMLITVGSFANNIIPQKENSRDFQSFFAKRNLMNASISALEKSSGKHFSFIQRLGIKHAQHQIKKEFKKRNLLSGCDTLLLKNGDSIFAIVSQVGTSEITYKNCNNQTGANYVVKKSDVASIHFANGSIDYLQNRGGNYIEERAVNTEMVTTDPMAIASFVSSGLAALLLLVSGAGLGLIGLGLLVGGIVTGFMSRKRIKDSKGKLKGKGLANAGIIIGFSLLLLFLLLIVLVVILIAIP